MKKKMLAVICTLAFAFTALADTWTDPDTGITWNYTVNADEATLECPAVPETTEGAITIPKGLGGHPVTGIGDLAFSTCTNLAAVCLSDSVKTIGAGAFSNCTSLIALFVPKSVTAVGKDAFSYPMAQGQPTYYGYLEFEGAPPTGLSESGITAGQIRYHQAEAPAEWSALLTATNYPRAIVWPLPDTTGTSSYYSYGGGYSSYLEIRDGIAWTFSVTGGKASIGLARDSGNSYSYITWPKSLVTLSGKINIPSFLGGRPITSIGSSALFGCSAITAVTIPEGVTTIESSAFSGCSALTSLDIPDSVASIDKRAFYKCSSLTTIIFRGNIPDFGASSYDYSYSYGSDYYANPDASSVFYGTPRTMQIQVSADSIGWDDYAEDPASAPWGKRAVVCDGVVISGSNAKPIVGEGQTVVSLTVTNVSLHYVLNSIPSSMAAPVTPETGIVNVMTEIKGGNVAIPETWAANYSSFATKFGTDFAAALTKPTGKVDAGGNALLVWQDYVAGTDPTDEESVFVASVTMVEGRPVISHSPELGEAEAAKRLYTTWGKAKLQDADWVQVAAGEEANYNFFKVTVEMK